MLSIKNLGENTKLLKWLEKTVASKLTPDVSNYAKKRLRVWVNKEPSLTNPTNVRLSNLQIHNNLWNRLQEMIDWEFDYCLITFSGDPPIGIAPHRDASYADYEAYGLNVNNHCQFDYWAGRESYGYSPDVHSYNPEKDKPTNSVILQPGDLVRFNCKNLHRAVPSANRWNINFWRAKTV